MKINTKSKTMKFAAGTLMAAAGILGAANATAVQASAATNNPVQTVNANEWHTEKATFTVQGTLALRTAPNETGSIIMNMPSGSKIKYDAYKQVGNHLWLRQPRLDGSYGYIVGRIGNVNQGTFEGGVANQSNTVTQSQTAPVTNTVQNNMQHVNTVTQNTQNKNNVTQVQNNQAAQPQTTNAGEPNFNSSMSDIQSYVLGRMGRETRIPTSTWNKIIGRESGWNPQIRNSQGYYGLFQLSPGYPGNGGSIKQQVDNAVQLANTQGIGAWAATAY